MMPSHHGFRPIEKRQYKDCSYCNKRKSIMCLTCGFCNEFHPVIEAIEEEKPTKVPPSFNLSKLDDIEESLL